MRQLKTKLKSYSFWTALSASSVIFCTQIGKLFGFSIETKVVEDIIMSICGVLVTFGVVCIPIKTEEKSENNIDNSEEN